MKVMKMNEHLAYGYMNLQILEIRILIMNLLGCESFILFSPTMKFCVFNNLKRILFFSFV